MPLENELLAVCIGKCYGSLEVVSHIKADLWKCRCKAHHTPAYFEEVREADLIQGTVVACKECKKRATGDNLFGKEVGSFKILGKSGNHRYKASSNYLLWVAQCSNCGRCAEYTTSELHDKRTRCKNCPEDTFRLPEEVPKQATKKLKEGATKQITVNGYERNPKARDECIEHYKAKNNGCVKCEICGFDFGAVYGEIFKNKIHVHHIVELSSIGEEYEVNPTKDLIPICPNCHMIAHSKKDAYTPEEIRNMLKNKSK